MEKTRKRNPITAFFDILQAKIAVRKLIPPLGNCEICGKPYDKLVVHDTGDGWCPAWECDEYCGWGEHFIVGWFWWREWVWQQDWEAVGFEIV